MICYLVLFYFVLKYIGHVEKEAARKFVNLKSIFNPIIYNCSLKYFKITILQILKNQKSVFSNIVFYIH